MHNLTFSDISGCNHQHSDILAIVHTCKESCRCCAAGSKKNSDNSAQTPMPHPDQHLRMADSVALDFIGKFGAREKNSPNELIDRNITKNCNRDKTLAMHRPAPLTILIDKNARGRS